MRWTHGRKALLGAFLVAVIMAAVVIKSSVWPTRSHEATHPYEEGGIPAEVMGITVWSSGLPNPHKKGEKVDVFSVTLLNPTKPSSGEDYVSVGLLSRNNEMEPDVMTATSGEYGTSLCGPCWTGRLLPRHKTTVFFVARTTGIMTYCARTTHDMKPWRRCAST